MIVGRGRQGSSIRKAYGTLRPSRLAPSAQRRTQAAIGRGFLFLFAAALEAGLAPAGALCIPLVCLGLFLVGKTRLGDFTILPEEDSEAQEGIYKQCKHYGIRFIVTAPFVDVAEE